VTRLLDTDSPIHLETLPAEEVVDGAPRAGARALGTLGELEVGVWEMTTGAATDVEADEVFVVLAGSATVAFDDGDSLDLSPGVAVRLHAGDRTTWTVHEPLRKLYLG
jgi:uncharacterized cupin superfamily protein